MQAPAQAQDVSTLLKLINNKQQPQQSSQAQSAQQVPSGGLEAIFAQFSQSQQHMPQAPMQPTAPQPAAYNIQAALAAMQIPNQPQPAYAPPLQSQQPNLQSILAQINQQPQAQMQNYNYGANTYHGNHDRKRQAEVDEQGSGDYGYGQGKRQKGPEKKVLPSLVAAWICANRSTLQYFGVPTQPCRYWQEGKCKKGSNCTYIHD